MKSCRVCPGRRVLASYRRFAIGVCPEHLSCIPSSQETKMSLYPSGFARSGFCKSSGQRARNSTEPTNQSWSNQLPLIIFGFYNQCFDFKRVKTDTTGNRHQLSPFWCEPDCNLLRCQCCNISAIRLNTNTSIVGWYSLIILWEMEMENLTNSECCCCLISVARNVTGTLPLTRYQQCSFSDGSRSRQMFVYADIS